MVHARPQTRNMIPLLMAAILLCACFSATSHFPGTQGAGVSILAGKNVTATPTFGDSGRLRFAQPTTVITSLAPLNVRAIFADIAAGLRAQPFHVGDLFSVRLRI